MHQSAVKIEEKEAFLSPCYQPPTPAPRPQKNKCFEKWSIEQNMLYIQFLRENKEKLGCQFDRRSTRIFSLMSKFVMSRTSEQCRTHHQKMVHQCSSIDEIVEKMLAKKKKKQSVKQPKKRGRKSKSEMDQLSQGEEKQEKIFYLKTDETLPKEGIDYKTGYALVVIDLNQFEQI